MSLKLIPGDSPSVQPMQWPAMGAQPNDGGARGNPVEAAGGLEDPQVTIGLQRRVQELERQLEQRTREAYQQGQTAGQAAAVQQAQQQLQPVMARLAKAVDEITGLRRRVRGEAEEDTVKLAIAVARKVLYREITVDSESLLGLVKAAMQRVDAREMHRVRMHPDDIPMLERSLQTSGMPARLEVMADPSLERGGLILETTRGNLDASIGTQLAEIERGFVDLLRRSRDDR